jgi:hypothetical protein
MKNGDIVYGYDWRMGYTKRVAVPFRYRFEPVPGIGKMKGSYFGSNYKTPRTTNERKQWYASEGYGRLKRSAHMLPEAWDDYPRSDRYNKKSWKKSRKVLRQWQKNL